MADEKSAPEKKEQRNEGNVKETIESILVAFILAFIFRAFVVEAFVIPTGSMGPTLMGAHFRVTCEDCGYSYQVNFSTGQQDDIEIPSYYKPDKPQNAPSVVCPNCGYRQRLAQNGQEPIYFGDRILVLKYRYLFEEPARWDVVVFKSPFESKRDPNDPKYLDNYIKRLVARPHESVMILDGDIYIGKEGSRDRTSFQIQRKPRYAQDALWRIVYDNDYLPLGLSRSLFGDDWREPWEVESGTGWQGPYGAGTASRVFRFANPRGSSAISFNSTVNQSHDVLTDWLAYDQVDRGGGSGAYVSDLKLQCFYQRQSGDGPLKLELTKKQYVFTAEFLPGKVVLHRDRLEQPNPFRIGAPVWQKPIEADVPELNAGAPPVRIELSNVDYKVTVRVNGRDVITTTDDQYKPDIAALYHAFDDSSRPGSSESDKPVVRIVGENQSCSLEHLSLWRDVYYINNGQHNRPEGQVPSGQPFWGSPNNIQDLGADEYFVCGDNSQVSLDARFWGAPVDLPHEGNYHVAAGKVPGRFMLGKAFFVYWPAWYRPAGLPYGIVPDFGDMRFIH